MVSANRQSAGHEAVWQQKGARQRTDTSKDRRPLGHPSVQLFQVSNSDALNVARLNRPNVVVVFCVCVCVQILLGPVHAVAAGCQSDHFAGCHIVFQR